MGIGAKKEEITTEAHEVSQFPPLPPKGLHALQAASLHRTAVSFTSRKMTTGGKREREAAVPRGVVSATTIANEDDSTTLALLSCVAAL